MKGAHVVSLIAEPLPESPDFSEVDGAYVNVFTTAGNEKEAVRVASHEIAEAGWRVIGIEEIHWVTEASYDQDDTGLEYFQQVLVDDIVLVFHTYRHDSDDPVH